MTISTHVLDATSGRPAADFGVRLERRAAADWDLITEDRTDADGRITGLASPAAGTYRLTFDVEAYRPNGFYPEISVTFRVHDPAGHVHVPLLLSAYAYSTYRGS